MDLLGELPDASRPTPLDLLGNLPGASAPACVDLLGDLPGVGHTVDLSQHCLCIHGDLPDEGRTVDLSQPAVLPSPELPKRVYVDIGPVVDLSVSSQSKISNASMRATSSTNRGSSSSRESEHGPTNIEGGSLTISGALKQFSGKVFLQMVVQHVPRAAQVPRIVINTYTLIARKHLRPWNEFLNVRPRRILNALKTSQRDGSLKVHLRRNVLANARRFYPNYVFVFMLTLLIFVMSSPFLALALSGVGAGWSCAMRSDSFQNQPWTLQIGTLTLPLGRGVKSVMLTVPTVLFLHLFMGTILWSAALTSGGISVVHAAVMDRDDGEDQEDRHSCFEA